jgi:hypothetical protein
MSQRGSNTSMHRADRDARFHVTALLSGRKFRLSDDERELDFGDGLRAGHTTGERGVDAIAIVTSYDWFEHPPSAVHQCEVSGTVGAGWGPTNLMPNTD